MPWTPLTPHGTLFLVLVLVLFLTKPNMAQQPPSFPESPQNYNSPMATALIVMIIVFFTVGFISVYLRHVLACLGIRAYGFRRNGGGGGSWTRESPCGLDPLVVNSFPNFLYSDVKLHRIGKTTTLECAICITEFTDHERLLLLPKCNHVFHPHCIQPWFASHVTCPVCRANLETQVNDQRTTIEHNIQPMSEDEPEPSDQIIHQDDDRHRDVIVRVEPSPEITEKSPMNEIMKGLSESGRMIRLPRSHSTGHSFIVDCERFTLTLPEDVRHKLVNVNNLRGLPAAIVSPRVGYRANIMGCDPIHGVKPDRWRFSMSPPFISRPGTPKWEGAMECNTNVNSSSNNNNMSTTAGILRSPINLLKSMKSPNKSPLNHVVRCNDIGERSSDRLWANQVPKELDLKGHV